MQDLIADELKTIGARGAHYLPFPESVMVAGFWVPGVGSMTYSSGMQIIGMLRVSTYWVVQGWQPLPVNDALNLNYRCGKFVKAFNSLGFPDEEQIKGSYSRSFSADPRRGVRQWSVYSLSGVRELLMLMGKNFGHPTSSRFTAIDLANFKLLDTGFGPQDLNAGQLIRKHFKQPEPGSLAQYIETA